MARIVKIDGIIAEPNSNSACDLCTDKLKGIQISEVKKYYRKTFVLWLRGVSELSNDLKIITGKKTPISPCRHRAEKRIKP